MRKALVVLSGGQDSTTCLFWAKKHFGEVHALTFDYGQRHAVEIEAAMKVCALAGVASHETLPSGSGILASTSPLVNFGHSVAQYESAEVLPGGLEATFVPMRNALFLILAANRAVALGCDTLVTGVCQEDFGGYPDCRARFIASAELMINEALGTIHDSKHPDTCDDDCDHCGRAEGYIEIATPLMDLTKAESVALAGTLPGCFEALAFSHTCYNGHFPPCGHCHACLLRAKGFNAHGVVDPLVDRANSMPRTFGTVTGRFSSEGLGNISEVEK